MKAKILLAAMAAAIIALTATAEIPQGYYTSLNGLKQKDLKAALHDIINPHSEISSYSDLPQYFRYTDVYPNSNRWWDMYSDIPLYAPSFSGLNREHSFPKSWWGGKTDIPAYIDLNHLYPSEAAANMAKSNYPLGEVMTSTFDNGVTVVGYAVTGQGGGAAKVFEPADEYKGDFARTYFYMVTCYSNLTWNPNYMYMLQQNDYPTLTGWAIDLLLKWHRADPVSQKELDRNDVVFGYQNNRNPFIDYPELAEYIWGDKQDQAFTVTDSGSTGEPNLITPTQGMALDFNQVAINNTSTARLFFHGENCKGYFSLTLTGDDKDFFSIDTRTISASVVNTSSGYWLTVNYTPTALGEHHAKIIISDGGLTGSRGIDLIGECLPVPTLSTLNATAPTDITSDSYVANWDAAPADEDVDYYIVTVTRYVGGYASSEEIEAETNSLTVSGFNGSDSESYSVQSVRLGYRSPMSNVVTVDHSGIASIMAEASPLAVNSYPGCIRFICTGKQTGCRIYDTAGRLVITLPEIWNDLEVTLPRGLYLVVTDSTPRPLKAVSY